METRRISSVALNVAALKVGRALALQKLTIYGAGVLSGETGSVGKGEVNDIFVGVGNGTDTVATIVTPAVE